MHNVVSVMKIWLRATAYRLEQARQQLGFVKPLSVADEQEVQRWLPASALPLFATMSDADKQHSLRVYRGLQAQGCVEDDMLAAALLHDVGKAQGRVPFWTRPAIVLGKLFAPRLLVRLVIAPTFAGNVGTDVARPRSNRLPRGRATSVPTWRRSLSYAWYHADVGADLAADAGLSQRAVLYIRTHHDPHGPAAALHHVDEVS